MKSEVELAWAAGFFDGEGSVSKIRRGVIASVSQADVRPLQRLLDAVGEGRLHGPYVGEDRTTMYVYRANGQAALRVLARLWPYLCEPKREQAMAVLAVTNEARDGLVELVLPI